MACGSASGGLDAVASRGAACASVVSRDSKRSACSTSSCSARTSGRHSRCGDAIDTPVRHRRGRKVRPSARCSAQRMLGSAPHTSSISMARHRSRLLTASPARARRASARASRACGSRGARKRRSRSASARSSDVPPRSCHDSAALPGASIGTTFGHDTGHQPARPDCGPTSRQSAAEWTASADSKASVRARSSVSVVPSRPSVIRRVAPPRRATATAVAGHTPHDGRSRASRRMPALRSKAAIGADGSISSAARLPSSSDSLRGASSRPPGWRSTRTRSGVRAWRWSAAAPVGSVTTSTRPRTARRSAATASRPGPPPATTTGDPAGKRGRPNGTSARTKRANAGSRPAPVKRPKWRS